VERWQGGELSDPDAVEALKAVEEDVMEVDDAAGENNMEAAKYALRVHLLEEESETIESESQAQQVADEIVTAFDQRVDCDYPGWETNQPTVNEIQLILLDVLVKKHELGVLVQDDDFADAARRYLIENYA
jgi:type I restriction enzyme R subunit